MGAHGVTGLVPCSRNRYDVRAMTNTRPPHLDKLGKLCVEGQEVATYLFQVPDDESQWQRIRQIVDGILQETSRSPRKELPRIAEELREALDGPPSMMVAEQLQSGFDRLVKLWKAARSGLH